VINSVSRLQISPVASACRAFFFSVVPDSRGPPNSLFRNSAEQECDIPIARAAFSGLINFHPLPYE
jgi:hypothetical protein